MLTNINSFLKLHAAKVTEILFRRTSTMESRGCKNILVEPFYGGSHKQLMDLLAREIESCQMFTLPDKKWHWKARTSALYFSQVIPVSPDHRTIFASSVLNLAELVALRPDIARLNKVVYVHENQLCYPVRVQKDRDFQYGYNQILTCMVADTVVFNSRFNMESFLSNIHTFLKKIRDHRPKHLEQKLRPKCRVIYFPLEFPDGEGITESQDLIKSLPPNSTGDLAKQVSDCVVNSDARNRITESKSVREENTRSDAAIDKTTSQEALQEILEFKSVYKEISSSDGLRNDKTSPEALQAIPKFESVHKETSSSHGPRNDKTRQKYDKVTSATCSKQPNRVLHLVWAHRWEHDKDPETFFQVLYKLHEAGCQFQLSVLGERFTEIPEIFLEAKEKLKDHILHWGYLENKLQYYHILQHADVSISTALHEFYGVAMLESVYFGCFPLCPNRLVYPEIFPDKCLYNTPNQLFKKLKNMSTKPESVKLHLPQIQIDNYMWRNLKPEFIKLF